MAALAMAAALVGLSVQPAAAAGFDPCGSGGNPVACENSKPGTPATEWDVQSTSGTAIQGFATSTSVTAGGSISFKIKAARDYSVDIYRLGYYGGDGARRQAPTWTVTSPVSQPACATDPSTYNYDCGTWAVSTQWQVPSDAVSGVYIAQLNMGADASEIPFVVRDSRSSDVVFKTSDATWQAYNTYGGSSFYTAPGSLTGTQARAFKISYNRPYVTRDREAGRDFLYGNEYPTLRFLERNGIDVTYTTDVDVSTGATTLTSSKTILSVGHDEYWTKPERDRVTAARDAGVNLMFLSGNEVYWHTRLEASIDGRSTPSRTIVCYKDSWEPTKIDPSAEGTPTWRDPAYPAPSGTQPENALTGTMYMSNFTDLPITVSADQGQSRLWRGTSLATMAPGTSQVLAPHTVGYESDEDVDNGHRPPGLMRLSETTGPTPQAVQNPAGTQVADGTTTHSVTLYRAPSGALVFGAGTINWGWGLDQYHDGDNSNPADPRMQQATLNMLADMGVLPTTLMTGLVFPAASTDVQAPTVTVATPAGGQSLGNGTRVTVSGTAVDAGGGRVAAVEVSLDSGTTYHLASGTTSWSYSGIMTGVGAGTVKVRATDDSANLGAAVPVGVAVTCPCSLFGVRTPDVPTSSDSTGVELGVRFTASADGYISGVRFSKGSGNTGTHIGTLWSSTGSALASGTFTDESGSGWQSLAFGEAVPVTAGTTYVASYWAPNGHYTATSGFFAADWSAAPLRAPGAASSAANGVYAVGRGFPTQSYQNTNYWVDVLYSRDDTTPPAVSSTSPVNGARDVATTVKPSATFQGTVDPSSLTMSLVDASGADVAGSAAFDSSTRRAVFTPGQSLTRGAQYTATVRAVSAAGVPMAAAYTWSFTIALTDPAPGACPCSIWPASATPAEASTNDTASVQLGVRFTADTDGTVTAIRFYKGPLNVGTHTGSLWTATGQLLSSVQFSGESGTGWQTAYFTTPVDIAAGTTYVASYTAPNGGYAQSTGGLSNRVDSPPLHALSGGAVYTYGSGAPLTPSSTNYWVDLVFMATDVAPTVSSTQPGTGATNVNVGDPVSVVLHGQIQPGTARLTLKEAGGGSVDGAVVFDSGTRTLTLTPSTPLTAGASYDATVSGATALSGSVMSPYSWSFTTAGADRCPCTLFSSSASPAGADSGDPDAVELGVAFTPSAAGQVTGVRFYKSGLNTGIHTGSLWSSTGQLLARGTFGPESASGWQTLTFGQAVSVTAGTQYVASYYAPNGHYAASPQFFSGSYSNGPLTASATNGRYRYAGAPAFPSSTYGSTNYWVDPVFDRGTPADTQAPTVTQVSPIDGATSQPTGTRATATFGEAVSASSISFGLTAGGSSVTGTTTYDSTTRTATFTPAAALGRGVTYTASVRATDLAGNAMPSATTWRFTSAEPDPTTGVCPCRLWSDATQPTSLADADTLPIELGTQFTADRAGRVSGVRFYTGPENTGPHPVSLWAADGTRLATATPTSESTTGWQLATFADPVTVSADTAYVVSYRAPAGRYSSTSAGLSAALDRAPLHTAANAGRYVYGSGFPSTVAGTSYLVDPVFIDAAPPDTTGPVVSAVATTASGSSATVTWTTDEAASSVVTYGLAGGALDQTVTGAIGTTHSVTLTGLSSATAYDLRVTSVDAAGNSATSPAAGSSPRTFTSADTEAPVISDLAATGSGTTATVTWTTDESATTTVAFGTSAGLGQTATGNVGKSHSVTLTGLVANSRYYYRVTSADPAGNSATAPAAAQPPAQYAPTVQPVVRTSVADFATGSGGYVADSSGGEVIAAPRSGFELAGSSLPSGLTSTAVVTGGTATVGSGVLTVDGRQVGGNTVSAAANVASRARLVPGARLGLTRTVGAATGARAVFAVDPAGALSAVVSDGTSDRVAAIGGTWTSEWHVYRVDWTTTAVTFSIDGVQQASAAVAIGGGLQPAVIASVPGSPLVVDWLRVGPYAASSTYTSAVVDASAAVGWDSVVADSVVPAGTSVTILVRTGPNPQPGTRWTTWSTVPQPTGAVAASSRYLQYRIVSTTSGTRFGYPETKGITVSFHVL